MTDTEGSSGDDPVVKKYSSLLSSTTKFSARPFFEISGKGMGHE